MPIEERLSDVPGIALTTAYSHAVTTTGRLAFVAGQVALDADGRLVGPDDLAAQTAQSLENLHRVLRALGADWADIARLNWYVLDASQLQVIRDIRRRMMCDANGDVVNPASTLVQVQALFRPGFLVEVDAVVALPD
jgi:enamine deaminase RidA (YjgF/YER057c/UK114 family)